MLLVLVQHQYRRDLSSFYDVSKLQLANGRSHELGCGLEGMNNTLYYYSLQYYCL